MDGLPLSACWTLPDHVDLAARRWPEIEALVFGDERLTFTDFRERTRTVARALRAVGVTPGEHVAVLMENVPDMLVAIYGAARIGAVPVPINARFKARELHFVIGHSDAVALIASASFAPTLAEALALPDAPQLRHTIFHGETGRGLSWGEFLAAGAPDPAADADLDHLQTRIAVKDTALMMYTSGTTANPKGCPISHESLVRSGRIFGEERFPMRPGDRMFDPLPLFHLASILPFNGCLTTGTTYIGQTYFDAAGALELLRAERCTVAFPAFDLIWAAILARPEFDTTDLSRLRLVNVNGVPERLEAMAARTPWLTQISPYGATEGGGVMALSHLEDPLEYRVGSAGRPFAGMEVRIVDPETGAELPIGERGEITYRGPVVFDGYYKQPEETVKAFDTAGYFHSGDLGKVDADGRLSYLGRIKDMLKVGGENVSAAEIEGFLLEHPAIAEVQIVAAPDERYVEVPCAFVVLAPGAALELEDLIEFTYGRVATYKIPRYLRIVEEWPMSGTKIQKYRLRERIAAELAAAGIRSAPKIGAPVAG